MPETATKRPTILAIALIVFGIVGLVAAFALTLDKFSLLENPNQRLNCDISPFFSCTVNLKSWQGSLFGFPNPLLGVIGWTVVITIGVALLAGARFPAWFWVLFNVGVAGALALVIFLIAQSILVLGTLCPWCMVTWSVTIPTFVLVTLRNMKFGALPGKRIGAAAYSWVPAITLIGYVIVIVFAQVRLDVIDQF